MKKLGMIGGTGPESTIEYYKQIEYGVYERTGSFPELIIESLSVYDVLDYCDKKDYKGLTEYLLHGFSCLKDARADFACLTGITPHIVFEEVRSKAAIPLISILETACAYAGSHGCDKIGLLGTYPTMSGSFVQDTFRREGIEVVTPTEAEMRFIGGKIESELELGKIIPETQERLCEIVSRMATEDHIQAVALGCTELPLILDDRYTAVPCIDVMKIHVDRLIEEIIDVHE